MSAAGTSPLRRTDVRGWRERQRDGPRRRTGREGGADSGTLGDLRRRRGERAHQQQREQSQTRAAVGAARRGLLQPRVERVAQAVAEEIEAEHGDEDRETGEERDPGIRTE